MIGSVENEKEDLSMNIQQLKYVVEVEKVGSMRGAAKTLYIAQSSLSTAIKELEAEIGITIFHRSQKGVILTTEGAEFITYAKQVLAQLNVIEETYIKKEIVETCFSVTSQHYDFASEALARLIKHSKEKPNFTYRLLEADSKKVLKDVAENASEIGFIYISEFNSKVLEKAIQEYELNSEVLYEFHPQVFVRKAHPLAKKKQVTYCDLKAYPVLTFGQSVPNEPAYSEIPLEIQNQDRKVIISDRTSAINLLLNTESYLTGSGIMRNGLIREQIVAVPLDSQHEHQIALITSKKRELSAIAKQYIIFTKEEIANRSAQEVCTK